MTTQITAAKETIVYGVCCIFLLLEFLDERIWVNSSLAWVTDSWLPETLETGKGGGGPHCGQTSEHAQCTRTRSPAAKISRAKI